jgi:hypothetical protein
MRYEIWSFPVGLFARVQAQKKRWPAPLPVGRRPIEEETVSEDRSSYKIPRPRFFLNRI